MEILIMNNEQLETMAMLIGPNVSRMKLGEISDCEGLFDLELLNSFPASERQYRCFHPISVLVAKDMVSLEFVGFDSKQNNLYRKIKK
jgi:hypothetical protein